MFSPIKTLYLHFPLTFFLRVLFLVLIFAAVVAIVYRLHRKSKLDKRTSIAAIALVLYVLLVLFYTVLGRRTQVDYYHASFDIVALYTRLFSDIGAQMLKEAVLNMLMFVPVGLGVCFVVKRQKVLFAIIAGALLSLIIEVSQLVLQNGYTEITDLIHNTLGAAVGSLIYILIKYAYSVIKKQRQR